MARVNLGKVVPEKGVDYFTNEEIEEIEQQIKTDINIEEVTQNISQLQQEQQEQNTQITKNKNAIGVTDITYDTTQIYNTGDITTQNEKIYKCKEDNVTGQFDSTKWEEISLYEYQKIQDEKLEENYKVINNLEEDIEDLNDNQLTGPANGESIDLNDSAKAKIRNPKLTGKSWQNTTTGKNKLNNEMEEGTLDSNGQPASSSTGQIRTKNYSEVEPNTQYTLSNDKNYAVYIYEYDENYSLVNSYTGGAYQGNHTTITTTSTTKYIKTRGISNQNDLTVKYMLNLGSTVEPYEEYTGGTASPNPDYQQEIHRTGDNGSINEKIQNANLVDIEELLNQNAENVVKNDDGSYTFTPKNSSYNTGYPVKIPVPSKYSYKIKSGTGVNFRLRFVYEDGTVTDGQGNGTGSEEVSINNQPSVIHGDVVEIRFNWTTRGTFRIKDFMFNKGSTALPYVAHAEQNISFPLSEGQVLAEGDYLADDGVHHVTKEATVKIDSLVTLPNENKAGVYNVSDKIQDKISFTKCENAIFTEIRTNLEGTYYANNKNFVLAGNSEDTLETIKEKYDGAKILYTLAEEVIEPYTEAQAEAWEQIKKIKTYKNVTHISSEDETPATMDMVYVRDLQTVIDSLTNAIISLGGNV